MLFLFCFILTLEVDFFAYIATFILRGKINLQQSMLAKGKNTSNQWQSTHSKGGKTLDNSFSMPVNVVLCFMLLLCFNDIAGWLFFCFCARLLPSFKGESTRDNQQSMLVEEKQKTTIISSSSSFHCHLLLLSSSSCSAFRRTLVGSMPPCLQMNAIVTWIHCMKHHTQTTIRLLCKEHFGVMYTIGYQNKKTIGRWWQSNGFI